MKKHSTRTIEELENLAEEMGDLEYNSLSDFLESLAIKFLTDSNKNKNIGRVKLSQELEMASIYVRKASESIENAYGLSKRFVEE
jgi:hypothetical protein